MEIINKIPTHSLHNVGRRIKEYYLSALCYFKLLRVSNLMETWLRNTTETDFMITCNHVSADGQFDSDASVPAGAVNSERLSERWEICFIVLHCVHVQASLDR